MSIKRFLLGSAILIIGAGTLRAQNRVPVRGQVQINCGQTSPGGRYAGDPLRKAIIHVRVTKGQIEKRDLITDNEGNFTHPAMPKGTYQFDAISGYEFSKTVPPWNYNVTKREIQRDPTPPQLEAYNSTNNIAQPDPICVRQVEVQVPKPNDPQWDESPTGSTESGEADVQNRAIAGIVQEGDANPVEQARVALYRVEGDSVVREKSVPLGITDKNGRFELALNGLADADYLVVISKEGYRQASAYFDAGASAERNILFNEDSDPVRLETTEGTHRILISPRALEALPLGNIRNYDQFALLSPGVLPAPQTIGRTGPGIAPGIGSAGEFSANGLRSRENNFTIDGADNNDEDVGSRRQGFVSPVPQVVESVQEIQFITLLGDARYLRNIGAHVNVLTKAGGSDFHGTAYGFATHESLNARDFFNTGAATVPGTELMIDGSVRSFRFDGPDKDRNRTNQFGASLGGPFGSTFLSGSIESQNIRSIQTHHFAVPAAGQRTLFNSGTGDNPAPGSSFLPSSLPGNAVFSLFPFPNNPAGPYGTNTFSSVLPQDADGDLASAKFEWRKRGQTVEHALSTRLAGGRESSRIAAAAGGIDSALEPQIKSGNVSVIFDSIFGTKVANTFRFSFGLTYGKFEERSSLDAPLLLNVTQAGQSGAQRFISGDSAAGRAVLEELKISGTSSTAITGPLGRVVIAGFSPIGLDPLRFPQTRDQHTWQWADDLNWFVNARHILNFGFDFRRTSLKNKLPTPRPVAVFSGLAAENGGARLDSVQMTAAGIPTQLIAPDPFSLSTETAAGRSLALVTGVIHKTQAEMFVQDNWRVSQRLQLNIGGRLGFNRLPRGVNDRFLGFGLEQAAALPVNLETVFRRDRVQNDLRLGFAWDPELRLRTVLRGGFGTYTGQFPLVVLNESRGTSAALAVANYAQSPANVDERFLFNVPLLVGALRPGPTTPQPKEPIEPVFLFTQPSDHFKVPYAYHYALTAETEWPGNFLSVISYVGTQGRKLLRVTTPDLGPGRAIFALNGIRPMSGAPQFPVLDGSVYSVPQQSSYPVSRTVFEGTANSSYNSLQLELRKYYSKGIEFGTAFTCSHSIDDASDFFETAGSFALPEDSRVRSERGSASFDARFRLAFHLVWDIAPHTTGWLKGLQLSGIYAAQSGQPYTVNSSFDVNRDGNLTDRLNDATDLNRQVTDGGRVRLRIPVPAKVSTFDLLAAPGNDGSTGRNTFRAAGTNDVDIALSKRFSWRETQSIFVRFEAFNVLNHTHFGIPVRILESPGFGSAVNTVIPARTIQFATKLNF